jgi:chromosome segregation ATPase
MIPWHAPRWPSAVARAAATLANLQAIMDTDQSHQPVDHAADSGLAQKLEDQCAQAEEFFASERLRMEVIEAELTEELGQLSAHLAELSEGAERAMNVAAVEEDLCQRAQAMDALQQELQQREEDLKAAQAELEAKQEELDRATRRLANDEEALEKEQAATRRQRRRIASELKARREEMLEELAQQRAELDDLKSQADDQANEALAAVTAERDQLLGERDQLQTELEQQRAALEEARCAVSDEANEAVHSLTAERDELRRQRDELQQQLDALPSEMADSGGASAADVEELQDRLDLAMQDIRELKQRNTELEEAAAASQGSADNDGDTAFDWEAQKRRLIASLDGEDDAPPVDSEDRLTIEETIRKTDDIVAAKDRQIAQLKQAIEQRLAEMTTETAAAAPAPADTPNQAVQEEISRDELLQQERDRLAKLQEELREKQRAAEVEISLERAKLAREKAEIENKLADMDEVVEKRIAELQSKNEGQLPTKRRSRWRSRLGLDGSDD